MISKHKVLIVATSPKTKGGITSVISSHIKGEQWRQYNCKWIVSHRDVYHLRKLSILLVGLMKFVFYLPGAKIVHLHLSESTSAKRKKLFFSLSKKAHKKIIIHFHAFSPETTINGTCANLYKELFSGADAVIVLSNYWKEQVNSKFNLGDKVRVIYNPCGSIEYFEQYNKTNSILYAGTLNQRKGYADLIKAFALIGKQHSDWELRLAGNGELEQARELARSLNMENQVEILGWVNGVQKDKVYKEAAIFCLPSYAEGFPMAVLDAWTYGLPVITTPVGGIPDIAQNGTNMLVFNPGDINGLAHCLDIMISNERLRSSIAEESNRLASNVFNIDTINKQIGDLYEELLKTETGGGYKCLILSKLNCEGGNVLLKAA